MFGDKYEKDYVSVGAVPTGIVGELYDVGTACKIRLSDGLRLLAQRFETSRGSFWEHARKYDKKTLRQTKVQRTEPAERGRRRKTTRTSII